ncbi:unnamed protein product [Gadus morhua 'NCC']
MMDTIVSTQHRSRRSWQGFSPLVGTAEFPVPTSSFSVHADRQSQVSRGVLRENRERARRSPNESCQSSAALNPGPRSVALHPPAPINNSSRGARPPAASGETNLV